MASSASKAQDRVARIFARQKAREEEMAKKEAQRAAEEKRGQEERLKEVKESEEAEQWQSRLRLRREADSGLVGASADGRVVKGPACACNAIEGDGDLSRDQNECKGKDHAVIGGAQWKRDDNGKWSACNVLKTKQPLSTSTPPKEVDSHIAWTKSSGGSWSSKLSAVEFKRSRILKREHLHAGHSSSREVKEYSVQATSSWLPLVMLKELGLSESLLRVEDFSDSVSMLRKLFSQYYVSSNSQTKRELFRLTMVCADHVEDVWVNEDLLKNIRSLMETAAETLRYQVPDGEISTEPQAVREERIDSIERVLIDDLPPRENVLTDAYAGPPEADGPFQELPDEILLEVFYQLGIIDPFTLANAGAVCRRWRPVANDAYLFRRLLLIGSVDPDSDQAHVERAFRNSMDATNAPAGLILKRLFYQNSHLNARGLPGLFHCTNCNQLFWGLAAKGCLMAQQKSKSNFTREGDQTIFPWLGEWVNGRWQRRRPRSLHRSMAEENHKRGYRVPPESVLEEVLKL